MENCCHPKGYRDKPETFQCIVRLQSSHEHSPCLLWQKHSLGQGLVPCLPKYFMLKYQTNKKIAIPQGWLQPWASYDHPTACLGQADVLPCTRDRLTSGLPMACPRTVCNSLALSHHFIVLWLKIPYSHPRETPRAFWTDNLVQSSCYCQKKDP